MSRAQFLRHWQIDHPSYVRRLPGLRRYRQNVAIEHRKVWPADGVAELWFDAVRDVAAAFDGPEARELFAHEEEFIEGMQWLIVDEHEVTLGTEGVG